MRAWVVIVGVWLGGCAAGLAEVKPLIDACRVQRVEYVRAGVFVVERAPPDGGATRERRIEYGGDVGALQRALADAEPRCGVVPTLRE